MDEIATLSHEIEFHEKFRGYDPDEVDAYVDRVRKVAALATGRIEELHHRAEAAEAMVASGRVESAEETLGRTLLLAQQTADQLVDGAREEAARITAEAEGRVASMMAEAELESAASVEQAREEAAAIRQEANDQASRLLAEAETDRREMIRSAEAQAMASAEEAHGRLAGEVSTLSATRDFLKDDIDILDRYLREQKANLALVVSALNDLVERPGALQLDPTPATSGVEVPTPVEPAGAEVEATADVDDGATAVDAVPEADAVLEVDAIPVQPIEEYAAPVVEESTTSPDQPAELDNEIIDLDELEADNDSDHLAPEVEPAPDPVPPRLATAADLEPPEAHTDVVDPGPATAPIPVVGPEALFAEEPTGDGTDLFAPNPSGLSEGDLLSEDSEALAAFFDQDDDETDRSWFGRRR